jgi:hypothetical protein
MYIYILSIILIGLSPGWGWIDILCRFLPYLPEADPSTSSG